MASEDVDPRADALRARDRDVIEAVLAELLPGTRKLLFRVLGPRPDLDDALQESLIAIADALPRYEGRASLATFARKITLRVSYRYFRRSPVETPLELVPPLPDTLDPESRAMSRETLRRLYRCLDKLPKRRRVAFALCAIEGMSPTEAGEIAGVRPGTMRARLMHARREVARMLASDPYVQALLGEEVSS
jgi:RNA polymerase sigma-70 factor (ECF subfamily)